MRNYFKELDELDSGVSREENVEQLREAYRKWHQRIGKEAEFKQTAIREAREIFSDQSKYESYLSSLLEQVVMPFLDEDVRRSRLLPPKQFQILRNHAEREGLNDTLVKEYLDSFDIEVRLPSRKDSQSRRESARSHTDTQLAQRRVDNAVRYSEIFSIGLAGIATVMLLDALPAAIKDSNEVGAIRSASSALILVIPTLALGTAALFPGSRVIWALLGLSATVFVGYLAGNSLIGHSVYVFFFVGSMFLFVTCLAHAALKAVIRLKIGGGTSQVRMIKTFLMALLPSIILILMLTIAYLLLLLNINAELARFTSIYVNDTIAGGITLVNQSIGYTITAINEQIIPTIMNTAAAFDSSWVWLAASWIFFGSLAMLAVIEILGIPNQRLRRVLTKFLAIGLTVKGAEFLMGLVILQNPYSALTNVMDPPSNLAALITEHQYVLAAVAAMLYWHFLKKLRIFAILVTLFLLMPILAGEVYVPADLSSKELSELIGSFIGYWLDLINAIGNAMQRQT